MKTKSAKVKEKPATAPSGPSKRETGVGKVFWYILSSSAHESSAPWESSSKGASHYD